MMCTGCMTWNAKNGNKKVEKIKAERKLAKGGMNVRIYIFLSS